jgi:hypothetical protein
MVIPARFLLEGSPREATALNADVNNRHVIDIGDGSARLPRCVAAGYACVLHYLFEMLTLLTLLWTRVRCHAGSITEKAPVSRSCRGAGR